MGQLMANREASALFTLVFRIFDIDLIPFGENSPITFDVARSFLNNHAFQIRQLVRAKGWPLPKFPMLSHYCPRFSNDDVFRRLSMLAFCQQRLD
jgi:hypothetical protein